MTNNFEGWKHIATAPKDKEILVWDGCIRTVAKWNEYEQSWIACGILPVPATHWRGCPLPPVEALPDDEE